MKPIPDDFNWLRWLKIVLSVSLAFWSLDILGSLFFPFGSLMDSRNLALIGLLCVGPIWPFLVLSVIVLVIVALFDNAYRRFLIKALSIISMFIVVNVPLCREFCIKNLARRRP